MIPRNRLVFTGLFAMACQTRAVPDSVPPSAATSPEATPGPHIVVTRALDEDPPLPGEAGVAHWRGLAEPQATRASHDHRGHGRGSGGETGSSDDGDTVYACPMHPEVTSDEAGTCHKCGRTLEEQS